MIIAIDVMSSEMTPELIIRGVIHSAQNDQSGDEYVLVGQRNILERLLKALLKEDLPISLQDASQRILDNENPVKALRDKPDASICVAAKMVRDKKAQALISAGHVAAAVGASRFFLKCIPGIKRPALAVRTPNITGESIMIDAGANHHTNSDHLLQFALMGKVYAEYLLGIPNPKVGLLSIGEEDSKGNDLVKETIQKFKESAFNFIGNIEGKDIYTSKVDVIICNGFVGHVAWKVGESLVSNVQKILYDQINKTFIRRLGKVLAHETFKEIEKKANVDEHGGAPLLGVQGISVIANPSLSPLGIERAIQVAKECYTNQINLNIVQAIDFKLLDS